jgi:hypothetical protein
MELKFVEIVLVLDCIFSNTAQTASNDYISCHAALNILALQLIASAQCLSYAGYHIENG